MLCKYHAKDSFMNRHNIIATQIGFTIHRLRHARSIPCCSGFVLNHSNGTAIANGNTPHDVWYIRIDKDRKPSKKKKQFYITFYCLSLH